MPRSNSSVPKHRKHRKLLKLAKGYRGARSRTFVNATDSVEKALQYSYRDRRTKKRDIRRLWIARINAMVRQYGLSYSKFIKALTDKQVGLNRKVLAELAVNDPSGFAEVVNLVK
ncbi:MAG: 50S ribosomal protein L20 [Candidatus Marinimicrobia bacterium]|nr:50S ribosomal protein L20 [Candidatus Neomarinimicrobiota bacterium]